MKRLIGCIAALCLLAIMVGCGGVTSTGTLAYVSNSAGTGFTVFTVNTDGTLTKSSISPQNTPAAPKVLQFAPNGKWAYFLDQGGGQIISFTRSGNGQLTTQIDSRPTGGQASSLVVTPASTFIYVALPNTKKLAIFAIDQATGIPSQVGSSLPVGFAITQLLMAPGGGVMYALAGNFPDPTDPTGKAFLNGQTILAFTLNASSGLLTQASVTSVGVTPNYMILSNNGNFMYVLDTTSTTPNLGTDIFAFNVSGATLQTMSGQPFHENPNPLTGVLPSNPIAGATSGDNRFLFVANQGGQNISVFKILQAAGTTGQTAGELQEVTGATVTTTNPPTSTASPFDCLGCTPSFVAVSNSNNALYVLDTNAGKIFQFQINQGTGRLRALNPNSVTAESAGSKPTWITIR